MPGRDGTGPQGMGPMTGWGAGYCAGNRAGNGNLGGRGWQCGGGRGQRNGFASGGRGWRNMFYATGQPGWRRSGWVDNPAPEKEVQDLKAQAAVLEDELKQVNQRLAEVENADKAE